VTTLFFPELAFNSRDREYKTYKENLRDEIIYEYLFNGKSRRWLDEKILRLDPKYSKGWQSFGILNYVGLTDKHKGILKNRTIDEVLQFLLNQQSQNYDLIVLALTRYSESIRDKPIIDDFSFFRTPQNAKILLKQVGSSQYTDGVRIDKEFHEVFNPPESPYYVERGKARRIKVLFNNKIFLADYRFENQEDKSVILQSIRFRKELKNEFAKVFPYPMGEFTIQQGKDLNHFVFSHLVGHTQDEEEMEYSEGKIAFIKHKTYERNPKVIKKAKEKFAKEHNGRLFCEVCDIDFHKLYGEIGEGFIEGHHKRMVCQMKEGDTTKPEDIAMLCSNCHRMIHRKALVTVEELKKLIKKDIFNL
jgi:ribosomal protein L44E